MVYLVTTKGAPPMPTQGESWNVTLHADGVTIDMIVCIEPPYGIRCADAEVKAIKGKLAQGYKNVRALRSSFRAYYDIEAAS